MTTQDGRAVWSELTGHIVLHSEDIIGTGGEGTVFLLPAHPEYVAKIYHRDKLTDSTIRKLEVMIGYPPNAIDDKTGHLYVAWPTPTRCTTRKEVPSSDFLCGRWKRLTVCMDITFPL